MRNLKGHTSKTYQPPIRIPSREELEEAAAIFTGKKRIAILVGAGARGAGAPAFRDAGGPDAGAWLAR